MRIIAGTKRSLPLKTAEGKDTRPTTDRIKETLFNILQDAVPGAVFLDLFAGSGQIGLEALSRGARRAVFIDSSKKAASCITDNIAFTKSVENSQLLCMDVLPALKSIEGKYQFDLIFMDPPYGQQLEKNVLAYLAGSSLLNEHTRIVIETELHTDFSYLSELGFDIQREKKYKTNRHLFLRKIEKTGIEQ